MGKATALSIVIALTGCQSMYGPSSERLPKPRVLKPPPTEPVAKVVVTYVDACTTDFRRSPAGVVRDIKGAEAAVAAGDAKVAAARTAAPATLGPLLIEGIDKYSAALRRDPYDADATLKLALAYDHVARKGCALALLTRIATLAAHPKFAADAKLKADDVRDHDEWFKDYRSQALAKLP